MERTGDILPGVLLDIAFFNSVTDNAPKQQRLSWEEVREHLGKHTVRKDKDGPLFSPVLYKPGAKRSSEAVERVSMAVVDLDHGADMDAVCASLEGREYLLYSTHSHTWENPRFRVVFPFAEPVERSDWPAVWRGVAAPFRGACDEACKDASRMFYLPSHPAGAFGVIRQGEGDWLHAEEMLKRAPAKNGRSAKAERTSPAHVSPGGPEALFAESRHVMEKDGRHEAARAFTWEMRRAGYAQAACESFRERFCEAANAMEGKDHAFTAEEYTALVEGAYAKEPALSSYPWTDSGNAERLLARYGEDLRFNRDSGRWMCWSGRHWDEDDGEASRKGLDVARRLFLEGEAALEEAKSIKDENARARAKSEAEQLKKFARKCESKEKLRNALECARWLRPETATAASAMDVSPWLLNCRNGTLDLQTGKLREHRREDLQSVLLDVDYDPEAQCPVFQQFLTDIFAGDGELMGWIQKAVGYSLTGDTSEQVMFVLHGGGANGKSTLVRLLAELLGGYHRKTPTATILERQDGGIPNDIARLCGARFVTAEETPAGKRLGESLVKSMTGGDTLTARFLHQEFFEYRPFFKLWLACNHLPRIDGQDHAIWRRLRVVPFRVRFGSGAGDSPLDKDLPEKLQLELPGVLAWAVEGCRVWQKEGLGTCRSVHEFTASYRDTQDVLGEFLQERCIVEPQSRVMAKDLHEAYTGWATERGEKPMSQRSFTMRLEERGGFTSVKRDGLKQWVGVGLMLEEAKRTLVPLGTTYMV